MSAISEVAARAGVSPTTVSHALNHAERVSKALRERVQKAVDDLGYAPNPQARSLRTGRTNVIAMLIPDILNPFYPELVRTAQLDLQAVGLDTLIFNTDVPGGHSQEHGRDYLGEIQRRRVDGLIVGDFALHGIHGELLDLDLPAVFIGQLTNAAVDSVRLDDFAGGRLMGEYLAAKGHRRVANVTGPSFFHEAMARAAGFEEGLAAGGAPMAAELRYEGSYLPPSGRDAVRWLLSEHRQHLPSAIFFANYLMASGALAEFADNGISVPDDIAVAVFDDLPQLEYVRPRLTTVGNSPTVLARRATEMLLERLNKKFDGPPRTEVVPCILHRHDTA